jgi:hypothetical protein
VAFRIKNIFLHTLILTAQNNALFERIAKALEDRNKS